MSKYKLGNPSAPDTHIIFQKPNTQYIERTHARINIPPTRARIFIWMVFTKSSQKLEKSKFVQISKNCKFFTQIIRMRYFNSQYEERIYSLHEKNFID